MCTQQNCNKYSDSACVITPGCAFVSQAIRRKSGRTSVGNMQYTMRALAAVGSTIVCLMIL